MAEKPAWIPDQYNPNDLPVLLELTRNNMGDVDCARREFAEWQYVHNPAGEPVFQVARDPANGVAVGQYVVIPIWVQVHGEKTLASLSLNTVTDERFRGKGIFTRLAERVYKNCAARSVWFTYGFPNQNSYHGLVRKLKFRDLGNVPVLVRPVSWRRLARKKTGSALLGLLAGLGGGIVNALGDAARSGPPASCTVREIQEFDERWDAFWERNRNRYPVMITRNRDYLNWRFASVPVRKYRVWMAEANGTLLGYIACRAADSFGVRVGFIIDFFVDHSPAGEDAERALVAEAVRSFEEERVDLIGTHSLAHTVEYRLLRGGGLWPVPDRLLPRPTPLCVRAHIEGNGAPPALFDARQWYMTLGDYDAV